MQTHKFLALAGICDSVVTRQRRRPAALFDIVGISLPAKRAGVGCNCGKGMVVRMKKDKSAAEESYVIGIDIGGTHFRIGAVAPDCQVYGFRKISVKELFCSSDPLEDLKDYLVLYMEENRLCGKVSAVSIGFPATLNRERTVVLQAPNVGYMENLPVVEYLNTHFGVPVFIDRDVCMTLYYDVRQLELPKKGLMIGCYFGTGIGNIICIDGEPLLGKDGVAGELGHIPVPGSKEPCGCGNIGCMENIAGGKYLSRLCKERYTDTAIEDIFTEHGQDELLTAFVDRIAMTVATEINILNPDFVLLGGGVPNMKDFPLSLLQERIFFHTRKPYPEKGLQLFFVKDTKAKSVIGAGIYAWERI